VQFTLISDTPEGTRKLAQALAPLLTKGDAILLHGDVGAGKTDLIRKIIQTQMAKLGVAEDVPSPTFTLVQTYELGETEYIHADLYRLSHPDEVFELGLERGFETSVCLIEWPEILGSLAPENALNIHISILDETKRGFRFSWTQPDWSDRLAALYSLDLNSRHS
jgi:tRNA threonylcarbamoyladenosine biosynthesis protein TsaE